MFDMHVARWIKARWDSIATDYSQFEALFGGVRDAAGAEFAEDMSVWWERLRRPGYVTVRTAFNIEVRTHPQIIVSLDGEEPAAQPLGYDFGVTDDGDDVYGQVVKQDVAIHIYTPSAEYARVFHEVVRQSILLALPFVGRLGFEGVEYMGGGDIMVDPDIMPHLEGLYVRQQRWSTFFSPQVTSSGDASKPPAVYATDVTVNGNSGGVSADDGS